MTETNTSNTIFNHLTVPYVSNNYSKIYHKGNYYMIGELDWNIDNFTIDNSEFRTFESFGKSNDYVIYIDHHVCYFKYYVINSNNEVFATQMGDFILTPDQVKNVAQRLRKKSYQK
jgi:hypothetical protein